MASPHEYRETMYQILFLGEMTPEMQARANEQRVKAAQKSKGTAPPQTAVAMLEAQRAKAKALADARTQ